MRNTQLKYKYSENVCTISFSRGKQKLFVLTHYWFRTVIRKPAFFFINLEKNRCDEENFIKSVNLVTFCPATPCLIILLCTLSRVIIWPYLVYIVSLLHFQFLTKYILNCNDVFYKAPFSPAIFWLNILKILNSSLFYLTIVFRIKSFYTTCYLSINNFMAYAVLHLVTILKDLWIGISKFVKYILAC